MCSKSSTSTAVNKTLRKYYARLTADLHSLYTAEAFSYNQVLPLVAEQQSDSLPQPVTYYIQEIDKVETVPAGLLKFIGYEPIDEEHCFFFFRVAPENLHDKLKAAERILRATLALVPLKGYMRLLVQHVEAIPERCFVTEHQLATAPLRRITV